MCTHVTHVYTRAMSQYLVLRWMDTVALHVCVYVGNERGDVLCLCTHL